ncbi:MAG: glycosyl transferase [Chloroflexi bacterium]|nr:glycosyl transferase [Chloroflexota bacterium]MDL1944199.1 glycosyltransferase [Chloroflexi bacterium CFX2]
MRIVLTVHQFFPHYFSGTEVLTYETAKELQRRGHTVSVFTAIPTQDSLTDDKRFGHYVYNGIPVESFYFNRDPMGSQTNPIEMEYDNHLVGDYFRGYLRREKPDVVHFFHLAHLSSSPVDACHDLGLPMVYTPTDFWFICPMYELRFPGNQICKGPDTFGVNCLRHYAANTRSRRFNLVFQRIPGLFFRTAISMMQKWGAVDNQYSPMLLALAQRQSFLRERLNRINKVIIPTKVMYSNLVNNGLETQRAVNVPFGINFEYLQNVRRQKPGRELRLGYIGTLSHHKGVHVLIKAVRQLVGKPVVLKIYGKVNELSGYYKELVRLSDGDSRIEFCGTFPNPEIGTVFSNLDALVVPSLWHENSPLVIYSAQYAKCPVIASNMAGMAEVIEHGKTGLLFEPDNEVELAETIETLLENPDLIQKLSDNAPRPLSIQEYVDRLLAVYNSLTAEKIGV